MEDLNGRVEGKDGSFRRENDAFCVSCCLASNWFRFNCSAIQVKLVSNNWSMKRHAVVEATA